MGNEAPFLLQLTRILEDRDIPLLPVLSAVTVSGTSNMYFAVSGLSSRLQVMLRFLPEALAAVAPNVGVPEIPPRSLLRVFVDGARVRAAHALVGPLAARDALDDVAPAGGREAWARIVGPMVASPGSAIAARYRFLTERRGAIVVHYPRRSDDDDRFAQGVDDLVARLGMPAEHRATWRSIHAMIGAGAELSMSTECTDAGPSGDVHFLYGPAAWDQVIDVVKRTYDAQQTRLAAAAFGKLAAAFEQVRGIELVFSPDHPPDVLVWLILHPSGPGAGRAFADVTEDGADAAEDLARQFLEAIDHWDEPERVAEREAFLAEKQRRQAAIFDVAYIRTGQRRPDEPLEEAIRKMTDYFAGQLEAAAVGASVVLDQPLPTMESGELVTLEVGSADGARYLDMIATRGKATTRERLLRGSTAQVVALLSAPQSTEYLVLLMNKLAARLGR